MGNIGRFGTTGVVVASALAITAATAHAGQLTHSTSSDGKTSIAYLGAGGEANNVTVNQSSPTSFTLTDTAPILDFTTECTVAANTATCTYSGILSLHLTELDDTATVTSSVPLGRVIDGLQQKSLIVAGGNGNDNITVSAPANSLNGEFGIPNDGAWLFGESLGGALAEQPGPGSDLPGNDRLIGGEETDQMYGGPGDDVVMGGGGRDSIDNVFPWPNPGTGFVSNAALGTDTASGGPGGDFIRGLEPAGSAAVDTIECGTGGEVGFLILDFVELGAGDNFYADCETVFHDILCPTTGGPCSGRAEITAPIGAGGSTASASGKRKGKGKRKKKVVLGTTKFGAAPGQTAKAVINLKRKAVKRVLRKRKSVRANQSVRGKGVGKQRTRFKLFK